MFSPVEKATFEFWMNGGAWGGKRTVMLNPADISFPTSKYMDYKMSLAKGDDKHPRDDHVPTNYHSQMSMLLHFDLVHEYETFISGATEAVASVAAFGVETLLGKMGAGSLAESDTFHVDRKYGIAFPWDVSLYNEALTVYSTLEALAKGVAPPGHKDAGKNLNINSQKVKFECADIKFIGFIDDFSSKIDYFSAWGAPLRAEVNLTLTKASDPSIKQGDKFVDDLSKVANLTETVSTVVSGILTNLRPSV